MSERKVKVGVVGVGVLGKLHARIYSELESADLVGVYDIDQDSAAKVASTYGASVFDEIDRLADEVEALSIAVPSNMHCEVSTRLMQGGIHLLVEKPIADNTADAEKMVKAAQEKGVILQVGHVERFNPVLQFLDGNLGQPRFIEAIRLASYPQPREGAMPRGTEVSVVLDLMIHDIEVILHLVKSKVKDVRAVGVPVLSPTEDIANTRLLFENGCVANVTASRISHERMRKIRVFEKDSYLSLDYQGQSGELYKKTAKGIIREEVPIEKEEPLVNELASFVDCVMHRDDPVVSGEHASDALRLATEICQHIRDGGS